MQLHRTLVECARQNRYCEAMKRIFDIMDRIRLSERFFGARRTALACQ